MMLTFKKAGYTTKEIDKLSMVMRIALQQVKLGVCSDTSGYCPNCQYKHLCSDMHRLIDYLEKT